MKEGDVMVWKPKRHIDGRVEEELLHPWYGHKVTIVQVERIWYAAMCKVKPVDAPKVNNPQAFVYWADDYELEEVKE